MRIVINPKRQQNWISRAKEETTLLAAGSLGCTEVTFSTNIPQRTQHYETFKPQTLRKALPEKTNVNCEIFAFLRQIQDRPTLNPTDWALHTPNSRPGPSYLKTSALNPSLIFKTRVGHLCLSIYLSITLSTHLYLYTYLSVSHAACLSVCSS